VRGLVTGIQRFYPASEVRFVDTVCKPTKDRQSALRKLIGVAEVMVTVGGQETNTTRQLVETCRAAGRRAFHIERPDELERGWLEDIENRWADRRHINNARNGPRCPYTAARNFIH
jgi:4-hydroxy-3-methylbut-2-enyl diphosphate reductase